MFRANCEPVSITIRFSPATTPTAMRSVPAWYPFHSPALNILLPLNQTARRLPPVLSQAVPALSAL